MDTSRPSGIQRGAIAVIPGYELLRPLGGGPLTHVFAARRQLDGAVTARQNCRVRSGPTYRCGAPAAPEALALCVIRHAHVVRLIDTHLGDEPQYLVLEYLHRRIAARSATVNSSSNRARLLGLPAKSRKDCKRFTAGQDAFTAISSQTIFSSSKADSRRPRSGDSHIGSAMRPHGQPKAMSWARPITWCRTSLRSRRGTTLPPTGAALASCSLKCSPANCRTNRSLSEVLNHAIAATAPSAVTRMPERLSAHRRLAESNPDGPAAWSTHRSRTRCTRDRSTRPSPCGLGTSHF